MLNGVWEGSAARAARLRIRLRLLARLRARRSSHTLDISSGGCLTWPRTWYHKMGGGGGQWTPPMRFQPFVRDGVVQLCGFQLGGRNSPALRHPGTLVSSSELPQFPEQPFAHASPSCAPPSHASPSHGHPHLAGLARSKKNVGDPRRACQGVPSLVSFRHATRKHCRPAACAPSCPQPLWCNFASYTSALDPLPQSESVGSVWGWGGGVRCLTGLLCFFRRLFVVSPVLSQPWCGTVLFASLAWHPAPAASIEGCVVGIYHFYLGRARVVLCELGLCELCRPVICDARFS